MAAQASCTTSWAVSLSSVSRRAWASRRWPVSLTRAAKSCCRPSRAPATCSATSARNCSVHPRLLSLQGARPEGKGSHSRSKIVHVNPRRSVRSSTSTGAWAAVPPAKPPSRPAAPCLPVRSRGIQNQRTLERSRARSGSQPGVNSRKDVGDGCQACISGHRVPVRLEGRLAEVGRNKAEGVPFSQGFQPIGLHRCSVLMSLAPCLLITARVSPFGRLDMTRPW